MQRNSATYTLGFAAGVCIVCSVIVATAAVALKPMQQRNVRLDRQLQVLQVAGLAPYGEKLGGKEIARQFDERIEVRYVDLDTGEYAPGDSIPEGYEPVEAAKGDERGHAAPDNRAGVSRMPDYGVVYLVKEQGQIEQVIIQAWGMGLWSTMYGFMALAEDGQTIKGLTFYEQGETPGLGGEVDNPKWKKHWAGRKAYGDEGKPAIVMRKGGAGPPSEDPHGFDALSGATITSRSVQYLLNFWLGPAGYGKYLEKFHGGASVQEPA